MKTLNRILFFSIILGALSWATPVVGVPCGRALVWVRGRHAEVVGKAGDRAALTAVVDGMLDYDGLAAEALRGEWEGMSPELRREFVVAVRDMVRGGYARLVDKVKDYDVTWACSSDGATIQGRAVPAVHGEPIEIDYRIIEDPHGRIMVRDVVVEGASLVGGYRSQFLKVIRRDGAAALLKKLRTKKNRD